MLDALEAPVRVARTGAVVVRLRRRLRSEHEVRTRVRDQHEGDTAVQHGGVVVRVASGDAVLAREAELAHHVRGGVGLARHRGDRDLCRGLARVRVGARVKG